MTSIVDFKLRLWGFSELGADHGPVLGRFLVGKARIAARLAVFEKHCKPIQCIFLIGLKYHDLPYLAFGSATTAERLLCSGSKTTLTSALRARATRLSMLMECPS